MGKRYVFWRDPKGKPYKKDFDRYAPHELLSEFGKATTINAAGDLSWSGFTIHKLELGLRLSAIVEDEEEELNETDSWRIVREALREAVKKVGGRQPLRSKSVLEIADARAETYFKIPLKRYAVISGLSVMEFPAKRIAISGCIIEPLSSRTKYPFPSYPSFTNSIGIKERLEACKKNQIVRVISSGRTSFEAFERAMRALNFLRSLWTIAASFGGWSINVGGPRRKPIGAIQISSVHTIHEPGGKPVENVYWYERDPTDAQDLFKPTFGWNQMEEFRQSAVRKVCRSKLKRETIEALCRYVVALDQVNHEIGFLQLWSVLEKLTDTVGGGSGGYEETIKRASWVFKDRALAIDLLEAARIRRNQYVHAAKPADQPDQTAYLLKMFVEQHLSHMINNRFNAKSLEEHTRYLTLSTEPKTLNNEIKSRKSVLAFLKK